MKQWTTLYVSLHFYAITYYCVQNGIDVCSSCSETHTSRLRVIQKKYLKLTLQLDKLKATYILDKEIAALKITRIGESSVLGFVNIALCGQCPVFCSPIIKYKVIPTMYKQNVHSQRLKLIHSLMIVLSK